jgi:hypothetical protein
MVNAEAAERKRDAAVRIVEKRILKKEGFLE